jgi:hypothetical protein
MCYEGGFDYVADYVRRLDPDDVCYKRMAPVLIAAGSVIYRCQKS